ncbi:hypothetical protein HUU05_27900, partial [candidate division KSB1 bacterium]|nr:hypothetical protein [candidate division KSB1 bacterium]
IRNEELLATSKIFSGKSDCRLFRAGYKFTLAKHYRTDWNADYVLTKIKMRGTQRGLFSILSTSQTVTPTYENMFEAIPVEIAYRPPRRTPIPRMHGIMSAKIESAANDEYAFIDDHGRYRAKMLYDISERKNGEATLPIRQVQSYSGSGYGMHFPNHAGTELVWACVDGNVDRPVGLGTVPNPTNFSPSTSSNKTQSVIRTAGQNELTFDDSSGGENIYLHATKDHTVQIINDKSQSVGNNEALEVGTNRTKIVGNDEKVTIGNNRDKSVTNDETVFVGKNQSESVGANKIEKIGANQTLRVASNQKETIGANKRSSIGGNLKEAIKGGVIQIIKKQMIRIVQAKVEKVLTNKTVKVGGSYRMLAAETNTTTEGASTETVGEAKELKAKTIAVEASEQIELKSGDGKIVITKDGKIVITGVDIKFESKTFDLAATEAVKIACTKNINIEAGGQNIIKGVPIKLN